MTAARPALTGLLGFTSAAAATLLAMVGGLMARDPALFEGLGQGLADTLPRLEAPRLPVGPAAEGPDGFTQGGFSGGEDGPDIRFEAADVSIGAAEPFRTAPARILTGADRWNAQGGGIAGLLDLPRDAQVELRRIVGGEAPACADGSPGAWLLLAHEGGDVALAVLSTAPGPDSPASALCAVQRAHR